MALRPSLFILDDQTKRSHAIYISVTEIYIWSGKTNTLHFHRNSIYLLLTTGPGLRLVKQCNTGHRTQCRCVDVSTICMFRRYYDLQEYPGIPETYVCYSKILYKVKLLYYIRYGHVLDILYAIIWSLPLPSSTTIRKFTLLLHTAREIA